MKKIMFNDKYQLTQAVLEGRKTMTRRLVKSDNIVSITTSDGAVHHVDKTFGSYHEYMDKDNKLWLAWSPYKVGEIVAVAQRYKDIPNPFYGRATDYTDAVGWENKMFVRADLMPHHIRITDIKLEHLQDISNEDCLREGIQAFDTPVGKTFVAGGVYVGQDARLKIAKGMINFAKSFKTPQEAFAVLIDRLSGKGTWENNPWVFVYSFELIK